MEFATDFILIAICLALMTALGFYAGLETRPDVYDVVNEYNITNVDEITEFTHNNITNEYTDYYKSWLTFYPRQERICSRSAKLRTNVKGISMQPFLFDGDDYWAEPVTFEEVELGDVIVWNKGESNVVHAVVGKYEDYLVTAGYNNLARDNRIDPDEIKYRWCFKQ